jgi:hypothetical protein
MVLQVYYGYYIYIFSLYFYTPEIFLQDLEQHRLKHLLEGNKIVYYNRYVGDIFIITPQTVLEQFNAQHRDLQFTINEETDTQIAYPDLNLVNKRGQLQMEVYRKPTATDVTINNTSCHPKEHKLAAYVYKSWIDRLLRLPLSESKERKELNTVINIALNNGYKKGDILKLHNRLKYPQNNQGNNSKTELKWVTFTYTANYIRKIKMPSKDANLKATLKRTTTVGTLLGNMHNAERHMQHYPAKPVITYTSGKLAEP